MSPKTQKSLRNLVRTNKLIDYRKGHFLSVTHHTVPSQWQLRVMRDDCIFFFILPFLLLCSFFQTNLPLTIGTSTPSLNALLYALRRCPELLVLSAALAAATTERRKDGSKRFRRLCNVCPGLCILKHVINLRKRDAFGRHLLQPHSCQHVISEVACYPPSRVRRRMVLPQCHGGPAPPDFPLREGRSTPLAWSSRD